MVRVHLGPPVPLEGIMKKFLLAAVAVAAGYAAWLEIERNRQDRAVWTEVTDPIA